MKIFVIGGTGHVGNYLVPKLVADGHDVYVGMRGKTRTIEDGYFQGAKIITCDSSKEESLQALKAYEFDTIVDFPGTAYGVWNALSDSIDHLVACGSLWMYGYPHVVPTPERSQDEVLFQSYAVRFEQIQEMLRQSGSRKAVFSAVMPPNICGPGKVPIDQYGGRSLERHREMLEGKVVYLPDGPECLIGPCDAEDIAQLFRLIVNHREESAGQLFNAGAAYSLSATDFVKEYGKIYGVELPIQKVSWEQYIREINPQIGNWWHFYAHMFPDITKARNLLGYSPKYTPQQTMRRAVEWMKEEGYVSF